MTESPKTITDVRSLAVADLQAIVKASAFNQKTLIRGLEYFKENRVGRIRPVGSSFLVSVIGSEDSYQCRLLLDKNLIFSGVCTCPAYEHGASCKHLIAAGMELSLNPKAVVKSWTALSVDKVYSKNLTKLGAPLLAELLMEAVANPQSLGIRVDLLVLSKAQHAKELSAYVKDLYAYSENLEYGGRDAIKQWFEDAFQLEVLMNDAVNLKSIAVDKIANKVLSLIDELSHYEEFYGHSFEMSSLRKKFQLFVPGAC